MTITVMAALAVLGTAAISACGSATAGATPVAAATGIADPTVTPSADPTATRSAGVTAAVREADLTDLLDAATPSGSVNYAVTLVNNVTGETYAYHGDELFATASIVKVDILATLLRQQSGTLTARQEALADTMIRESDNDAASSLWDDIGGVDGLDATDGAIGLTATTPGSDGWWGYTTTTVADQAKLVNAVTDPDGLLGAASTTVTDLMGSVTASQDWGVSAAARDGETFILKNGWMTRSDQDERWTVNSIGQITGTGTDLTIAVMSEGSDSSTDGIALVEKLAKLARDTLT